MHPTGSRTASSQLRRCAASDLLSEFLRYSTLTAGREVTMRTPSRRARLLLAASGLGGAALAALWWSTFLVFLAVVAKPPGRESRCARFSVEALMVAQ